MKKNVFIAFEGIDGSGKSTQVKLLSEKLNSADHKVYPTYEPTNGPVGLLLRNILKGSERADERTIAGLFVADRLDHLLNEKTGLLKKMEDGFTVITDRYYFSSYAYHGTHMDMDWVIKANAMSAEILKPDLHIFVDVDPEVCIQRIQQNRSHTELYETLENLKAVRNKYLEAFELLKSEERIIKINGNRLPEEISRDIWESVTREIGK